MIIELKERHKKISVSITIDDDILTYSQEFAKENNYTLSSLINTLLRETLGIKEKRAAKIITHSTGDETAGGAHIQNKKKLRNRSS